MVRHGGARRQDMKQARWKIAGWKPRRAARGVRAPEPRTIWIGAGVEVGINDRQDATTSHGEGL